MKIGLYQYQISWEDKKENIGKLRTALETISEDIDLLLLPEMSFTGFSMNTKITGEKDGETKEQIKSLCKKYNIAMGFGWVNGTEKSENHYTVISREGNTISDYIKIHPFSFSGEDNYFVGGESISCFELEETRFSSLICYDLRFPELFRVASKKADVIVVPANWPQKRREHWITLLKARAIENQVYIIGINCVGDIGGLSYSGDSAVIAPDGSVLLDVGDIEGIVTYGFSNMVKKYRDEFPTYRDRKDELYSKLQKEAIK